jgi:outer membrane lipoprotein SlyB
MRHVAFSLIAFAVAALAGCGPDYSPNTYDSTAVQQANPASQGVVVGVRRVDVSANGTAGAAVGAGAGGIAGAQTPGGVASAFGALGGALVGGLVGTAAEHTVADTYAYEYIVRKNAGGELVSVTQRDPTPLAVGQKVLVIAGKQARIVPDYTVAVDTPGKPDATGKDAANKDGGDKPAGADKPTASAGATAPAGTAPPPDPVVTTPLPPLSAQASNDAAGKPIQLAPPVAAAAGAGTAAAAAAAGADGTSGAATGLPAVPGVPAVPAVTSKTN